jgi:hypothetical protein
MNRSQLEHIIRAAGDIAGDDEIMIGVWTGKPLPPEKNLVFLNAVFLSQVIHNPFPPYFLKILARYSEKSDRIPTGMGSFLAYTGNLHPVAFYLPEETYMAGLK